jgi:hypothetical protein
MAKKRYTFDEFSYDEDEELLLDRKAKRKRMREMERQRQAEEAVNEVPEAPADDTMNRVVALCQENRWREANVLCIEAIARYLSEDKADNAAAIQQAQQKIDRALRRQMIAAFVVEADKMLNKE